MSAENSDRESLNEKIWFLARNSLVFEAFQTVDRRAFAPAGFRSWSYQDSVIHIAEGYSISQPTLVAEMVDNLRLTGEEKVLEIGTGSGYEAAILSLCAKEVFSIECHPKIARLAQKRLDTLGYSNVKVYTQDGALGLPEKAPFDAIVVSAGLRSIPSSLSEQMVTGGLIVAPIGKDPAFSRLIVTRKTVDGFLHYGIKEVIFWPLMSKEEGGWTEDLLKKLNSFKRTRSDELLEIELKERNISKEELLKEYAAKMRIEPEEDLNKVYEILASFVELKDEDFNQLGL
ncbi:protein-L-isoaspartate O-methyltransferase [Candidatus Curtissbacteria bacterium]|nr:protein-L-isoaspartate O-methyltransferase [Candidatus Curtissbacteria bacterium]